MNCAAILLYIVSGHHALPKAAKNRIEEEMVMNTKKLALFAGAVIVVAGGLIYTLGIYPPASMRGGEGAIGKRDVYRAEQPADASVNPGAAPVAMQATVDQMKNHKLPELQNGHDFPVE